MKQMYSLLNNKSLIYHLEPKLTSNAVQIILVNTHTNIGYS